MSRPSSDQQDPQEERRSRLTSLERRGESHHHQVYGKGSLSTNSNRIESPSLRLARYLKEFVGLRSTTVRDVAKYDSVLWFDEMPQAADCHSGAWTDDYDLAEPWLEVHKQEFERPPEAPDMITEWVDAEALRRATSSITPLRPNILWEDTELDLEEGETPPLVELPLEDYPEVVEAYRAFRPKWEAWAVEHRRREAVQDLYAKLFRLYSQLQKQSEIVEVVLGLGLMDWQAKSGNKSIPIRRHAVVGQVELTFDPGRGVIRVGAPSEGANLRVEDDMLEAELRPDRSNYDAVEAQLEEVGDAIWDKSLIHAPLKTWAGALSPDTVWSEGLSAKPSTGNDPVVSFAPALILRKRLQTGMVRIYEKLIQNLEDEAGEVPRGWGELTDDDWGDGGGKPSGCDDHDGMHSGSTSLPSEIYFPLPANREQRRIVNAIDRNQGVLVQGPPGTGKSHTIANLMCHLLATGKRVLITAETARALQVLKRKLPSEIQPLCVSLLGHGGDAFAELNTAVQGITNRQASYSPGTYDDRIAEIDHELDEARRRLAGIDSEIRSLREDETLSHSLLDGAYEGTASKIASRVADEREIFGWLRLARDAKNHPTISNAEAARWFEIRRRYSDEEVAASTLQIRSSATLTAPADFGGIVSKETTARTRSSDQVDALRPHPAFSPIRALPTDERNHLADDLRSIEEQRRSLQGGQVEWLLTALQEVVASRNAKWRTLLKLSKERIGQIEPLLPSLGNRVVTRPEGLDPRKVRSDAVAAAKHLQAGGKWKLLGLVTPKALKGRTYLKQDVLVDGQPADNVQKLSLVCDDLDLEFALADLVSLWKNVGVPDISADRRFCLPDLKPHVSALEDALEYGDACTQAAQNMSRKSPPVPTPNWLDGEAQRWVDLIVGAGIDEELDEAERQVVVCGQPLARLRGLHDVHPVVDELLDAIAARDMTAYSQCHQHVVAIERAREAQSERARIETAIRLAAPNLAEEIEASLNDPVWDDRLSHWENAWRWAWADGWLKKRSDFDYQQELWRRRHAAEVRKSGLVAEAASLRAWKDFFKRLSPRERNALKGWREAVCAMGKGTGKSAKIARLRREARNYMDDCRKAIPIWIMPRYLVAEMIDPSPGLYDLVIVDEASQLGIESLFLFYISKKIIVVGDDQQISPAGVGIPDADVAALQQHFLDGIPHKVALYPQSSVYANAKIRFNQNIVLREHFRCMPEIIQFSNDLCYASNGAPLDPLRAYPANRLQPLVRRHVPDGYRKGSAYYAQNPREAEAIVEQICACIDDPRYVGKTMGVISLQGEEQAKLIENMLLRALDPEVIVERRLICGDAYAFQGDERNVIFLSLVAAPGERRIGVLANEAARQRFNVAVSRAEDQLWLFHTVELDLLSDKCMRHALLSYMLDPGRKPTDPEEQRFESKFERHVYQRITERGFHVRAQVCVGDPVNHRYRIDLVVEGMQGRLAVECDGDKWHGPDRYEQDMARQRDLERAGWHFARIQGSDFYRDREKAMEPVWEELDHLGIRPGGVDDSAAAPPPPKSRGSQRRTEADFDEPSDGQPPSPELVEVVPTVTRPLDEASPTPTHGTDPKPAAREPMVEPQEEPEPTSYPENRPLPPNRDPVTPVPQRAARYVAFEGPAGPDPRHSTPAQVAEGLCRIIDTEGPMLVKRAYTLYLRGIGIARMGRPLKRAMNRSLQHAIRQGRVAKEDEFGTGGLVNSIVRIKGSPATVLRERGPRTFEEIPPSELQFIARKLSQDEGFESGSDDHVRAVLDSFGLKRLTVQRRLRFPDVLGASDRNVDDILDGGKPQ